MTDNLFDDLAASNYQQEGAFVGRLQTAVEAAHRNSGDGSQHFNGDSQGFADAQSHTPVENRFHSRFQNITPIQPSEAPGPDKEAGNLLSGLTGSIGNALKAKPSTLFPAKKPQEEDLCNFKNSPRGVAAFQTQESARKEDSKLSISALDHPQYGASHNESKQFYEQEIQKQLQHIQNVAMTEGHQKLPIDPAILQQLLSQQNARYRQQEQMQYQMQPDPTHRQPELSHQSRVHEDSNFYTNQSSHFINKENFQQENRKLSGSELPGKQRVNESAIAAGQQSLMMQEQAEQAKKRALMQNFDQMPLKEFHRQIKAIDGHQLEEEGQSAQTESEELANLSLAKRAQHPQWGPRKDAYAEIQALFQQRARNPSQETEFEDELQAERALPFETFAPLLPKMVADQVFSAQQEGLHCLLTFVQLVPRDGEVKTVMERVFASLIDKCQLNKPAIRELTKNIFISALRRRDGSMHMLSELSRRFGSKNGKLASFALWVANESLETEALWTDIPIHGLKFEEVSAACVHSNKEIREQALRLLSNLFAIVEEDVPTLIKQIKNLRPVQKKEITAMLEKVSKRNIQLKHLFHEQKMQSQPVQQVMEQTQAAVVDLTSLLPQNFSEIPYLTQINAKKSAMEGLNKSLHGLIQKQAQVAEKDYTSIFNVISHMVEDSNVLVYLEAIRTVDYLIQLLGASTSLLKPKKVRHFLQLIAEKYKETKTAVVQSVNETISSIFNNYLQFTFFTAVETLFAILAVHQKNPRVKHLLLEKIGAIINAQENNGQSSESELNQVIELAAEKLFLFATKDNSSNVRDSATTVIVALKCKCPISQAVEKVISKLPKMRQKEIQQRVEMVLREPNADLDVVASSELVSCPKQEVYDSFRQSPEKSQPEIKPSVYEIVESIQTCNTRNQQQYWLECLSTLEAIEVEKMKPSVISAAAWRLKGSPNLSQETTANLLQFLTKFFHVHKAFSSPQEYEDSLQVFLGASNLLSDQYYKTVRSFLNLIFASIDEPSTDFIPALEAACYNEQMGQQSAEHLFSWLNERCSQLLSRGVLAQDLEHLALQYSGQAQALLEQLAAERKQEEPEANEEPPLGERLCQAIDQSFESGLVQVRQLDHNQDFETKQLVFLKLLSIIASHTSEVTSQQAYSLKALQWMKETLFGIEETFQTIDRLMRTYAEQKLHARESSIVLFLLNTWAEGLTVRDLADRMAHCCADGDLGVFSPLLDWLTNFKLSGEEGFAFEDLRKIGLLAAGLLRQQQAQDFFELCLEKTGKQRLREIMEVTLMHSPEEFAYFSKWIDSHPQPSEPSSQSPARLESAKPLSYHDLRAKRKVHKAEEEDVESSQAISQKHEMMINRLNAQLRGELELTKQQKQQEQPTVEDLDLSQDQSHQDSILQSHQDKQEEEQSMISHQNGFQDNFSAFKEQIKEKLEVSELSGYPRKTCQDYYTSKSPSLSQKTDKASNNLRYEEKQKPEQECDSTLQSHREEFKKEQEAEEASQWITETEVSHQTINKEDLKQSQVFNQSIRDSQANFQEHLETQKIIEQEKNQWKKQMEELEMERKKIEQERLEIQRQKEENDKVIEAKFEVAQKQTNEVLEDLRQVNKSYMTQVEENRELKTNLYEIKNENNNLKAKVEEIEQKLQEPSNALLSSSAFAQDNQKREEKLRRQEMIEQIFQPARQALTSEGYQQDVETSEKVIKQISELLIYSEGQLENNLGEPLLKYYTQVQAYEQRLTIIKAMHQSLQNEDVAMALSVDVFQTVLNFCLNVFAIEKEKLEGQIVNQSITSSSRPESNQITQEIQLIVSRLLNSKEFTTSMTCLFKILRKVMPQDFSKELTEEQRQFLRVIMRCIHRITKALHSENPELLRVFDVLIEMYKFFMESPPEKLREDLPSLADFDFVYRGLKEVSDRFIELQPKKVAAFLDFIKDKPQNAFIIYMRQVVGAMNFQ